jgi:hemoglobin
LKDIQGKQDIKLLIDSFYKKLVKDDLIGFFFTEIISVDWETHLPIMYSFWESILLDTMSYKGNTMLKHIALNQKHKINAEHLDRWLEVWTQTNKSLFLGPLSEKAIQRAGQIAGLMKYKFEQAETDSYLMKFD